MEEKEYLLYKGLKKPLVFKGLKGKYIYQAGGAFAGTMLLSIILSKILGVFIGVVVAIVIGGGIIWDTFRRQSTHGLYTKTKNFKQIHIIGNRTKNRKLYGKIKI